MSFEQLLDLTMELPLDERENLVNILKKRIIEDKRQELSEYYKEIKTEFDNGNLKPLAFDKLLEELEKELD